MSALLIALGYVCGSVPFGLLVTKAIAGVDVRAQGSGNIGATNVSRVAGKKLGAVVLVLDAVKGLFPTYLAVKVLPGAVWLHAGVALAAFLGHVFPVWLRFRGGKGVATALGVMCVLAPAAALAGAVVYAVLFAIWRVSSIGSLAGGLSTVIAGVVLWLRGAPLAYGLLPSVLLLFMVWTHRDNLRRLRARTERAV